MFKDKITVWLVDATTYKVSMHEDLKKLKDSYFRVKSYAKYRHFGQHQPPGIFSFSIGLLRIATLLHKSGHNVFYLSVEQARKCLLGNPGLPIPDVIGFGAVCTTVPACVDLAVDLRKHFRKARIVLGGSQAFLSPNLIRNRWPVFDDIISDNDFIAASRLAGTLISSSNIEDSHLDYNLLPRPLTDYNINVITNIGCPFSCAYCSDRLHERTSLSLDGGLSYLSKFLPSMSTVHFCDSVLGGSYERALEVCRILTSINHSLLLSCDLRPEFIKLELLKALTAAGFVELRVGLDSANKNTLRMLKRGALPENAIRALNLIREHSNMYVSVYLVSGLPTNNEACFYSNEKMVEVLFENNLVDQIKHHLYVPYPTDQLVSGHPLIVLRHHNWSLYDRLSFPVFDLPDISAEQIWEAFLSLENSIVSHWAKAIELNTSNMLSTRMYPDYNIRNYSI